MRDWTISGVRKRMAAAFGANVTAQAVTVLIQLVSVPIFLHNWTLEQYGNWLILTAVPTYFALSDVGFIAVTINKMTMLAAGGARARVNEVFQTTIKLCLLAIAGAVVAAIFVAMLLNVAPFDSTENKIALVILVATALIAMSNGLADAVFRSSGEFALGTYIGSSARIIEWLGLLAGLLILGDFLGAAIGQFTGRLLASAVTLRIACVRHPGLRWGIGEASAHEFRTLLRPALQFMAFPIANACTIQGMTLIVGQLYGPAFLAIFNTYRTLSRVLVQAVTVVGRSIWPEISRVFGSGEGAMVMSLYKKGTAASVIVSIPLCFGLLLYGEPILRAWTSARVPFDQWLMVLFLVATLITSLWQMGMVVLSATNNHAALSWSYLFGSLASLLVPVLFHETLGNYAPVVGLIALEVFLVVMCLVHVSTFKRHQLRLA